MNSDSFAPEPSSNRNINININIDSGDKIEQNGSFGIAVNQGSADIGRDINGKIEGDNISSNNQKFVNENDDCKAVNQKEPSYQIVITLSGRDFKKFSNDIERQKALLLLLCQASGDTSINIKKIEKGSIKITLNGSLEGLKRLANLIKSGNLDEDFKQLGFEINNSELVVIDSQDKIDTDVIKTSNKFIPEQSHQQLLSTSVSPINDKKYTKKYLCLVVEDHPGVAEINCKLLTRIEPEAARL